MPNAASVKEQRLRKTKAQLIAEIETLERSAAAIDAAYRSSTPKGETPCNRDRPDEELAHLARFPSENPNPVLRVMPDGTVLYANKAAIAVEGLLKVRKSSKLTGDVAKDCAEASRTAVAKETEFENGDRVFAFSITPVAGETYINIYGRDISRERRAMEELAGKEEQLRAALDHMSGGFKLVDRDLSYVLVNPQYSEICSYPAGLVEVGGTMLDELRFQAERGDFGTGDEVEAIEKVLAIYRRGEAARWERTLATGRTIEVHVAPMPEGGYVNILTDITERKRGEQFLRTVIDMIPAALNIRDVNGRYVMMNRSLADYFGIAPEDAIGKHPNDTGASFDLREEKEFHQVVETGLAVVDVERQYPTDEGTEFWLTTRKPIHDAIGQPQYVLTIAYEITELRRAEEAMRESQQFLGTLVDNIPAAVFFRDLDGRYIRINRRYAEMFRVTNESVRGRTLYDVFPRYKADYFTAYDREASERRQILIREETFILQGVERIFEELNFPILDDFGKVIAVGGIDVDITDRKRAEEALRESQARFRQAARMANLGHWARNEIEDSWIYCSEELARIHGLTVDDYLAASNSEEGDHSRVHIDDHEEYKRVTNEWANGHDTYEIEYRIVRPDGDIRHVREMGEAIRDEKGRIVRSIGTKQDITEAKQGEQKLLDAQRRTEEANNLVIEKNRMLESLSSKLSKYLSPQVYSSIFSGKQSVEIASKRKKLTVFFSDIADFTGTTDSLESEELTDFLNHYLTEMSKIALDYGATIDKYVGDAIIAFFGDPETRGVKEDARTCVHMAIAMQLRMRELQSEWLDMGLERPFQLRIGINTGFCTVGNFGSGDRMDYTIIGNEVNLAARLQSYAEVGSILIAHETHSLVKDVVMAEAANTLNVKGFANPVRTYQVVGLYEELVDQGRIVREDEDGLTLIIDRNKLTKRSKARAIEAIEDVLSQLKGRADP